MTEEGKAHLLSLNSDVFLLALASLPDQLQHSKLNVQGYDTAQFRSLYVFRP
jgi:hypothetical protein